MSTTKLINVIVNGAKGRMGQEAILAISDDPQLNLVAALDKTDDLASAIKQYQANVVVDLTNAHSVFQNTKTIISNKACPVIGSSGLLENQLDELKVLAKEHQISGLIVPNFSLGAVLMMQFSEIAAKFFNNVEIIERHHPDKLDSPSGTAIRTADLIAKKITNTASPQSVETIPHALGANYKNIRIHSLRLNGSCAHQTVVFGGNAETLTIQHDSNNRKSFMPGLVLCCKKVQSLVGLQIGLETVLDL